MGVGGADGSETHRGVGFGVVEIENIVEEQGNSQVVRDES